MILETAKQFVEQTGTNKNQAPYYQAILFIYIVLLISYEERYIRPICYSLHKDFRIRLFALSIVAVSNEAR